MKVEPQGASKSVILFILNSEASADTENINKNRINLFHAMG